MAAFVQGLAASRHDVSVRHTRVRLWQPADVFAPVLQWRRWPTCGSFACGCLASVTRPSRKRCLRLFDYRGRTQALLPSGVEQSACRDADGNVECSQCFARRGTDLNRNVAGPSRLKRWWRSRAKFDKAKLRRRGLTALLSYGFLSNASAVLLILFSVYRACAVTGSSPLASAGALKQFGITYGGLYLLSNFLRPARMALAIGITPWFERTTSFFERVLSCSRTTAIGLQLFLFCIVGTLCMLCGGLWACSRATGVPLSLWSVGGFVRAGRAARSA